ncbi:hypothetical protein NMY22_g13436 [Coprinellus aureogranulatus]|nr:hypothetical protein NMY22_g13436 [Coprinellus aureogranulatus]
MNTGDPFEIIFTPKVPLAPPQSIKKKVPAGHRGRLLRRASASPLPLCLYPYPSSSPNATSGSIRPELSKGSQTQEHTTPEGVSQEVPTTRAFKLDEPEALTSPVIPTGLELHDDYLRKCKLNTFNPKTLRMSNVDILFTLGRVLGPGVTVSQFRQAMRRCFECRRVCFVERRHLHRCRGPVLPIEDVAFDVATALLGFREHSGLSNSDLRRLFARCSSCEHICLEGAVHLHKCPSQ